METPRGEESELHPKMEWPNLLVRRSSPMERTKYPRTFHLPWSPGATSDDKTHSAAAIEQMFAGRDVVVTEKLDGENSTVYPDGYCHARSVDGGGHPSRARLKALAAQIGHDIPSGHRICGENVFAEHSLSYDALSAFFYVFGIYNGATCLSWADTEEFAELLGLPLVPVLYRGVWDAPRIRELWTGASAFGAEGEGYVVRLEASFALPDFLQSVAKYVRSDHVQTDEHWMHGVFTPNKLAE